MNKWMNWRWAWLLVAAMAPWSGYGAVSTNLHDVHVEIWKGAGLGATNRIVLVRPISLSPPAGVVASYDVLRYTNGSTGDFWISNAMAGVWQADVQGPPNNTRFLFYVSASNEVQEASEQVVVPTGATYPGDTVAYSATAADARFLSATTPATNVVWPAAGYGLLGTTGALTVTLSVDTNVVGGSGSISNGSVFSGVMTNEDGMGSPWRFDGIRFINTNYSADVGVVNLAYGYWPVIGLNGESTFTALANQSHAPVSVYSGYLPTSRLMDFYSEGVLVSYIGHNGRLYGTATNALGIVDGNGTNRFSALQSGDTVISDGLGTNQLRVGDGGVTYRHGNRFVHLATNGAVQLRSVDLVGEAFTNTVIDSDANIQAKALALTAPATLASTGSNYVAGDMGSDTARFFGSGSGLFGLNAISNYQSGAVLDSPQLTGTTEFTTVVAENFRATNVVFMGSNYVSGRMGGSNAVFEGTFTGNGAGLAGVGSSVAAGTNVAATTNSGLVVISALTETNAAPAGVTIGTTPAVRWFVINDLAGNQFLFPAWRNTNCTAAAIGSNPTNYTTGTNYSAAFYVTATGSTPLSYQWLTNGVMALDGGRVSGAGTSALTISNVTLSDSNLLLSCWVTNACGSVTSTVATLSVTNWTCAGASIASSPTNRTVGTNSWALFSVSASGSSPISYYWYTNSVLVASDGGQLTGSASNVLIVSNTALANSNWTFQCVASNCGGTATSAVATLSVTGGVAAACGTIFQTNLVDNECLTTLDNKDQRLRITNSTTVCAVAVRLGAYEATGTRYYLSFWTGPNRTGSQLGGNSSTNTITTELVTGYWYTNAFSASPQLTNDCYMHLTAMDSATLYWRLDYTHAFGAGHYPFTDGADDEAYCSYHEGSALSNCDFDFIIFQ